MRFLMTVLTGACIFFSASHLQAASITGGTGLGGFEPLGGGGSLPLWFRGDNVDGLGNATLTNGDPVNTWVNSANPGTNDALAVNAPVFQTTPALNGRSVVLFDGAINREVDSGFNIAVGQDYTVFAVAQRSGATDTTLSSCCNGIVTAGNGAHRGDVLFLDNPRANGDNNINYLGYGRPDIPDVVGFNNGQSHVLVQQYNSSTDEITGNFDGTQQGPFSVSTTATPGPVVVGGEFGTGGSSHRNFLGPIAEAAIFARTLNTAERRIVENHLSSKFAVPITGDLYAGDSSGFDSDVFGIGSTALGPFPGSVMSAGSAGFGIDGTGSLGLESFVMAGHDGTPNSVLSSSPVFSRWARSWFVDVTGSLTDTVTLAFDWQDAGLGSINPSLNMLMISSDGVNFGLAGEFNTMISGDTIMFLDVPATLIDNAFVTVGQIPEPSTGLLLGIGWACVLRRRRKSACDHAYST